VYYSFRYSNAAFFALDGNSPYDNEQAAWLERELGAAQLDPQVRHIFLFVHQPPYAVGAYCGSERLQRKIIPLLLATQQKARAQLMGSLGKDGYKDGFKDALEQKVRAVFAGHEHAYQHLERQGIRYFVSGGGGAPLYYRSQSCNFEDDMALQLFRAEHHYLRVQVDGDAAMLTAVAKNSEVMERVPLNRPVAPDQFAAAGPPRISAAPPSALPGQHAPDEADGPQGAAGAAGAASADGEPLDQPEAGLLPPPAARPAAATAAVVDEPSGATRADPRARHGAGSDRLVALLWLSGLALLAGLLLLTRPAPRRRRRADLQPSARRQTGPSSRPVKARR
jgi:hypothetical protein